MNPFWEFFRPYDNPNRIPLLIIRMFMKAMLYSRNLVTAMLIAVFQRIVYQDLIP